MKNVVEYSVYVNREDVSKAEAEERDSFIRFILESIGLEFDDIWEEGKPLDAETKVNLWEFLDEYKIDIIHDGDRGYKIYIEGHVVGEWFKPRVVLRQDDKALKLSKRFFYEMQIKYLSEYQ